MGCSQSSSLESFSNPFAPGEMIETPEQLVHVIMSNYERLEQMREAGVNMIIELAGIEASQSEAKNRLIEFMASQEEVTNQRAPLMEERWEKDAENLQRVFVNKTNILNGNATADRDNMLNILCYRTTWQLNLIANKYKEKYGGELLNEVIGTLSGSLGTILKIPQVCKLFVYKLSVPCERDAGLMKDWMSGMTLANDCIIEFLLTRNNNQIKAVIDHYMEVNNGEYFPEVIKKKSGYKNYRELVYQMLQCDRDERCEPLNNDLALAYANELFAATAQKMVSADPEPYIRIFPNLNYVQFQSINDIYPKRSLMTDMTAKTGGDFQELLVGIATPKYDYLVTRLYALLKSSNEDGVCRVLGCLHRSECIQIRKKFDVKYSSTPMGTMLKSAVKDKLLLQALSNLIDENESNTPMGDLEDGEDLLTVSREGDRAMEHSVSNYRENLIMAKGQEFMGSSEYQRHHLEDDLTHFNLPIALNVMSLAGLQNTLEELTDAVHLAERVLDRLFEEINEQKVALFTTEKHCYEAETWIGLINSQITSLKNYAKPKIKKTK